MVCHGIAYIVLGCWIDANDNIYIENLAVDEKQCPPYCRRVGGGVYPFLSSALLITPVHVLFVSKGTY